MIEWKKLIKISLLWALLGSHSAFSGPSNPEFKLGADLRLKTQWAQDEGFQSRVFGSEARVYFTHSRGHWSSILKAGGRVEAGTFEYVSVQGDYAAKMGFRLWEASTGLQFDPFAFRIGIFHQKEVFYLIGENRSFPGLQEKVSFGPVQILAFQGTPQYTNASARQTTVFSTFPLYLREKVAFEPELGGGWSLGVGVGHVAFLGVDGPIANSSNGFGNQITGGTPNTATFDSQFQIVDASAFVKWNRHRLGIQASQNLGASANGLALIGSLESGFPLSSHFNLKPAFDFFVIQGDASIAYFASKERGYQNRQGLEVKLGLEWPGSQTLLEARWVYALPIVTGSQTAFHYLALQLKVGYEIL